MKARGTFLAARSFKVGRGVPAEPCRKGRRGPGSAGTLRLTSMALRPEDIRPILWSGTKPFAHRVKKDVRVFLFELRAVAQSMIKEIILPFDSVKALLITFPRPHHSLEARSGRKGDDRVHMIRHQEKQRGVPFHLLMVVIGTRQDFRPDISKAQLVLSARNAIDSDKEERPFIEPVRDEMCQAFADGPVHARKVPRHGKNVKPIKVGRGVPAEPCRKGRRGPGSAGRFACRKASARWIIRAQATLQAVEVDRARLGRDASPYLFRTHA
jgi:hypothetical protein